MVKGSYVAALFNQHLDLNPGCLGGKRQRYLCAMLSPYVCNAFMYFFSSKSKAEKSQLIKSRMEATKVFIDPIIFFSFPPSGQDF